MINKQFFIGCFMLLVANSALGQNELTKSKERGMTLYKSMCIACHMEDGKGVANAFPPLAKSDYLMADIDRSIKVVLNGANGEMKVNNKSYYGSMIGYKHLSNQELADIMNYIRNSWGNTGEIIKPSAIEKNRN